MLIASLVSACVRSLTTSSAKLTALDLLLCMSEQMLDEYKWVFLPRGEGGFVCLVFACISSAFMIC